MNKVGVVLGIAAVTVIAGCKDPDYVSRGNRAQDEVKTIEPVVVDQADKAKTLQPTPVEQPPVIVTTIDEKKPDDVVEPVTPPPPPAPVTTTYIVQRGDTLSKISLRYNIKMDAILAANPKLDKNKVRIGQKIQLPGQVEVGEQKLPQAAARPPVKKPFHAYTGATKDYVVKSGDTISGLAYGNGISIRQFKELNQLSSDNLKIGQKLKLPAAKAAPAAVVEPAAAVPAMKETQVKVDESKPVLAPAAVVEPAVGDTAPGPQENVQDDVAAALNVVDAAYTTYQVQEGDDMPNVSMIFGVDASKISELNNLQPGQELKVGQILKIPMTEK